MKRPDSVYVQVLDYDGNVTRQGWVISGTTETNWAKGWHARLQFADGVGVEEFTSRDTAQVVVLARSSSAIVSPMTVNLETTKTVQLFVVRGDVIVSGPYGADERDRAERGVTLTNEQLRNLGLDQDAQLAEVTQTVSYGKPKTLAADEQPSTDDDTPSAPVIDPAGPAVVQSAPGQTAAPVTPPTA